MSLLVFCKTTFTDFDLFISAGVKWVSWYRHVYAKRLVCFRRFSETCSFLIFTLFLEDLCVTSIPGFTKHTLGQSPHFKHFIWVEF